MPSAFAWLDFSEEDRRRALDVINFFREKDTRDELGVGVVRDALSDLLFPGTSTIQTRAAYFLFVPWIYRALEKQRAVARDAARFARKQEIDLIAALVAAGEKDGVIGIEAREGLKRLPSNIYWQGLGTWGIRAIDVSLSDYHRFFAGYAARATRKREAEDEGDNQAALRPVWHPAMPDEPEGFPGRASFALRKVDAEYLRERVLVRAPGTLLAYLVDNASSTSVCDFPWEHPQAASFPARNHVEIEHSRFYALALHGARLVYNLLLAEKSPMQDASEAVDRFNEDLDAWAAELEEERPNLLLWDRQEFWSLVTGVNRSVGTRTRAFVDAWIDLMLSNPAAQLKSLPQARALVGDRERRLKGPLSRLDNPRSLELWGGESGAYRDSYRWPKVQAIVNDIVKGLRGA